jgi:hypothetical protein
MFLNVHRFIESCMSNRKLNPKILIAKKAPKCNILFLQGFRDFLNIVRKMFEFLLLESSLNFVELRIFCYNFSSQESLFNINMIVKYWWRLSFRFFHFQINLNSNNWIHQNGSITKFFNQFQFLTSANILISTKSTSQHIFNKSALQRKKNGFTQHFFTHENVSNFYPHIMFYDKLILIYFKLKKFNRYRI